MLDFYADKMQTYIEMLHLNENDRIFPFTKSYLHHEIRRGCAASGVKRIRIHSIRHSHISLLIDMGFSAVAIADRVGHESIDITYRYAHVFPSTQMEVVSKLNKSDGYTSFGAGVKGPLVQSFGDMDYRYGKASHGYLPEKGPQPVFVVSGPDFAKNVVIEHAELVDEAPTYAKILGVDLPDADGSPVMELLKNGNEGDFER